MYMLNACRLFLLTSCVTCIIGCTSTSSTVSKNPVAVPTELYVAPVEAQPTLDTELKPSTPSKQDSDWVNQLTSIDHDLNNGHYDRAQQQLTQLASDASENLSLKNNVFILKAKLALLTGHPKQALVWLNQLDSRLVPTEEQQHYLLQLRSQALYRTHQVLSSAIVDMNNKVDNNVIWNKLLLLNISDLHTSQTNPTVSGWLSLTQISMNNANAFAPLKRMLMTWQSTYPEHPGNQFLAELKRPTSPSIEFPQNIAVILPLSGNYAALGLAVQYGILDAYYASPVKMRQRITFYDSGKDDISTLYSKILAQKDQLILGPLTKEDTEDLLKIAQESPRIISLNYTQINTPLSHIEFGLSPEDEAQQTAELAWREGKSSAIIITPKTSKGEQTAEAFSRAWTNLGGQIVDRYNYANNDDFSKSIMALLGVTESQWRQHTLRTTLNVRMNFTPYFRKDADMIFLSADPKSAKQIWPFIKFYAGDYFSVFATSNVYSGTQNINGDKDLNGIYFCDMPSIFNPTGFQGNKRLYFLGQDAYLLAMQRAHLDTLPHLPLIGATGRLTMNDTRHLQQELTCAQFKDGRATPLDAAR